MTPPLKPLEPRAPRWEPSADPHSIVVPGLDTTASVNDQVEQIEQLITIKLQNIDANFSKIQQVMANRVLPAVKRYAVGTEPVREAAKFWTTFFEEAAQIRVPTYEEYIADQTETEQESESSAPADQSTQQSSEDGTPNHSHTFIPDGTTSEVSFMPGQAAMASTPATARHRSQHDTFLSRDDASPSWSASLESPLVRLDREIQNLGRDDDVSAAASALQHDSFYDETQDITQRQIPRPTFEQPSYRADRSAVDKGKGKMKDTDQSLLHGVLRKTANTSVRSRNTTMVSPLKVKSKTPILKKMNPYLPPDTKPSDWKGVVDLSDPAVTTPRKTPYSAKQKKSTTPRVDPGLDLDDDIDSSLAMSPPVTLAFAKLPKAPTPKLGRTPRKAAAERIMKDLIGLEKRGYGGTPQSLSAASGYSFTKAGPSGATDTSMSSAPTPPSLSRYTRHPQQTSEISTSIADASLESMMRRVGLSVTELNYKTGSTAGHGDISSVSSSIPSLPRSSAFTRPPPPEPEMDTPQPPALNFSRLRDDELDDMNNNDDDSMDSLDYDEANNTANPSAAFLFASQQASYDEEDSFSSGHSDDSLAEEGELMESGQHPFAGQIIEGDEFDDSFDDPPFAAGDVEEETLFGVPPAQRLAQDAELRRRMSMHQMRVSNEALEDTIGIGEARARAGLVDETPTAAWAR